MQKNIIQNQNNQIIEKKIVSSHFASKEALCCGFWIENLEY